jgi:hypothetical protein
MTRCSRGANSRTDGDQRAHHRFRVSARRGHEPYGGGIFLSAAPAGWHALSARVEPADSLTTTAEMLLAGTEAAQFLDHSPPRSIGAIDNPQRMIALRNPSIQYELAADERWDLTNSGGVALRDEIRDRAEAFARNIAAQERRAS